MEVLGDLFRFFSRTQKVVASANCGDAVADWRHNCAGRRHSDCTIYLHAFLNDKTAACSASFAKKGGQQRQNKGKVAVSFQTPFSVIPLTFLSFRSPFSVIPSIPSVSFRAPARNPVWMLRSAQHDKKKMCSVQHDGVRRCNGRIKRQT